MPVKLHSAMKLGISILSAVKVRDYFIHLLVHIYILLVSMNKLHLVLQWLHGLFICRGDKDLIMGRHFLYNEGHFGLSNKTILGTTHSWSHRSPEK
jgi:hypothetical protein